MKLTTFFKRLFLIGIFAVGVAHAATPVSLADISGNGTASAVGTQGQTAHWITVYAAPTNATTACSTATYTGCPRVGDSSISTTRGIFLTPGTSYTFPADALTLPQYQLQQVWYLVQTNDKISIVYGQ
jgi:hypothetical protein